MEIHHLDNDKRLPLMSPERACRHRPSNLKFPGVLGINLVQTTVAGAGIISERHHPLIVVLGHLDQIFVSLSKHGSRSNRQVGADGDCQPIMLFHPDRKSTRLNSSHITISYAVFCLKKKTKR